MNNSHVITCGGIAPGEAVLKDRQCLRLDLWGNNTDANVWLHIEDIHDKLHWNIPDAFQDLVEIATYVYCADQSIRRDAHDVNTYGANWRRQLDFHIPVRCPDLWSSDAMQNALRTTVGFLSDDYYSFTFQAGKAPFAFQQYLELKGGDGKIGEPEQVMMFSGGLDSLAGAIEEAVVQKRRVMLVNHQSTPKLNRKHQELLQLLGKKANGFTPGHLRVRVNKDSEMTKDYLQRSRSFLYAAIGGAVAHALGLQSLRFYENGVVGLNLPGCAQVVGGRATRTAHPRVLNGFETVLSLVAGRTFSVENPFKWLTRGEIIKKIVDAGCGELIAASMTCAHTWQISNAVTHCGMCSQCVDRRFAMIAADAEKWDPGNQYRADIFTESPPKEEDKTMLATYVERANGVKALDSVRKFVTKFPEVLEAVPYLGGHTESAAARVLDLYTRHAKEVTSAMTMMTGRNLGRMLQRTLPADCLLQIVYQANCPEYSSTPGAVMGGTECRTGGSPDNNEVMLNLVRKVDGKIDQVLDQTTQVINQGFEVAKAKSALMETMAKGVLDWAAKIEPDDFRVLAAIMAAGDIAKAAVALNRPDSTVRSLVQSWPSKGTAYRLLPGLVSWRKKVGGKYKVPFNDAIDYKVTSATDYPRILRGILTDLENATAGDLPDVVQEVIELLREEVPR